MKAQHAARFGIYLVGMVLLALGITLNTKAGLGASAIVSVPYTVSQGTGWDFANLTLIVYCILVAAQFVIKGQNRRLIDLLQIVVSIVFTRFMALFQHGITYQSVLLPARNTTQSEKWRTAGAGQRCPIVSCKLPGVFICRKRIKRAAFLLPHGKNAALFQMLILR